ncbi:MAG: AMIN domain-containing protein [Gemmatimonadetes bacterium]|nr:AMIN domain-containing protein [Gemmatimonadota bacterium]
MRRPSAGAVLVAALLIGCGSPQGESAENIDYVDTVAAETDEPPGPVAGARTRPEGPSDTADPDRTADEGEAFTPTPDRGDGPPEWTSGRMSARSTADRPPVLVTDVRWARHPEFDRVVVDLGGEGGGLPGFALEYVDRPLHECGSGHEVHPVGDGWLQLRMDPAAAHTEAGEALLGREPLGPDLPQVVRIYRTCDFEGVVELVLAVNSPEPFRAFRLSEPRRIVVDVRR